MPAKSKLLTLLLFSVCEETVNYEGAPLCTCRQNVWATNYNSVKWNPKQQRKYKHSFNNIPSFVMRFITDSIC